jgi:bifunctional non-homologous end joining protein LigD
MPAKISPELPLLVAEAPTGSEWLLELKLDGYRMIGFVQRGKATLRTRRGHDWTDRFANIASALEELDSADAVLDGEIVALRADGRSDFQALQNRMRAGDDTRIVYFVFDLLYFRGHDLRQVPLLERKHFLSRLLGRGHFSVLHYNDHIPGQGSEVFAIACRNRLEGIVAKRADSQYVEGRTSDWVKVKCLKRQEFVIGGWTKPSRGREALGALLVGYYRAPSELVYCGRVGTGFTRQSLRELRDALEPLGHTRSPFSESAARIALRGVHWVRPKLVAEIVFSAWTADGLLRHASFQGLREDKAPAEITRETVTAGVPAPTDHAAGGRNSEDLDMAPASTHRAGIRKRSAEEFAGVRLTHPDRVLFRDPILTKRDLAVYYDAVAPFVLPHVAGRPLSLVRCPDGPTKGCFFQKHLGDTMPSAVHGIPITTNGEDATYIGIDDLAGLISLVQMNVLEIHPWASREDRLERPDRLIFDIDPGPRVQWHDVALAARHIKEHLADLGLESFVRTTGGNGLHVVAPVLRRTTWDELKSFAREFADALVREAPDRYIATSSKAKRVGKLFVDYLRNERGGTAIACYSTRARPGATVATPLAWDELTSSVSPSQFNVRTVPARLRSMKQDPWKGFFDLGQALTRTMHAQVARW